MLDWSVIPKSEVRDEEAPEFVASDSSSINTHALQKVDVLVVAIHNDTIARFQKIVSQVELEASFFEIEIFSTMRSVLDETLRPVLIVDMGAASTKLYIN
jgi:Tfp pilus assembly PilM family ATPase